MCEPCRVARRDREREQYAARRAAGLCGRCGTPAPSDAAYCDRCARSAAKRSRKKQKNARSRQRYGRRRARRLDTAKSGALYGRRACSPAGRPMWCWWRWPTRRPGWSGPCSAEAKPSGPKPDPPPNAERKKHYCEGDDDVMAKQGNRDRLNPRHCPSLELDSLTGRRSSDSIRASGNDCAAPKGRIDDCKPNPLLITKTTCNQGGVHR